MNMPLPPPAVPMSQADHQKACTDRYISAGLQALFEKVFFGDVAAETLADWQYTLYCEWLLNREKQGGKARGGLLNRPPPTGQVMSTQDARERTNAFVQANKR